MQTTDKYDNRFDDCGRPLARGDAMRRDLGAIERQLETVESEDRALELIEQREALARRIEAERIAWRARRERGLAEEREQAARLGELQRARERVERLEFSLRRDSFERVERQRAEARLAELREELAQAEAAATA